VLLLGLIIVGVGYAALTAQGTPASAASPSVVSASTIAEGKNLFEVSCSSCHGVDAGGTFQAPSLVGVGAAAVDFQMSTGRMPAKDIGPQVPEKPVTFTTQQIHAIADYIASLGGGPTIPSAAQVSPAGASTALGQSLFITDCAQCHNFDGAGGALTNGKYAPALNRATPTQIHDYAGPEAGHHRLHHQTPRRAEPRRVQPGPDRPGHRGHRGLPRRDRGAHLPRHVDHDEATWHTR